MNFQRVKMFKIAYNLLSFRSGNQKRKQQLLENLEIFKELQAGLVA